MAKIFKNEGSHRILGILLGLQGQNPLELIELAGRTSHSLLWLRNRFKIL